MQQQKAALSETMGAIWGLGLFLVLLNICAYDSSYLLNNQREIGWIGGVGLGLLLSMPTGYRRLLWRQPYPQNPQVRSWLVNLLDIAWRVALIVALEFVLREADLRYAFKSTGALFALAVFYQLWPVLPADTARNELSEKLNASSITMNLGLGTALLMFGWLAIGESWWWLLLLVSTGAGFLLSGVADLVDRPSLSPHVCVIVYLAGLAGQAILLVVLMGPVALLGIPIFLGTGVVALLVGHDFVWPS